MFLSEWREFPSATSGNLMTARVWMLLKSHASLTYFRTCFLPVRAKDLSVPRYILDSVVGIATVYGLTGDRIPVGAKFS